MRGSTVLLGGCDASIRLTKDEGLVTLSVEKQKDAEEVAPVSFSMKQVEWVSGVAGQISTLVPVRTERLVVIERRLEAAEIAATFDEIEQAWNAATPWSEWPRSSRYLPRWIREQFEVSKEVAEGALSDWIYGGNLVSEPYNRATRGKGLRVIKRPEVGQ